MLVSNFINDELKSYEEEKQDYLICIYENGIKVANEWIEDFMNNASQYLHREIEKIEYYSESADVYIK